MRIADWRVEGFGVFASTTSGPVAPGLTVIHGPNEAGKSTLLSFLRGVLFGFPDRRMREPRHEPLNGGRHGGSVRLLDGDGRAWTVQRYAEKRELSVTRPDGHGGNEADLAALLGGVDAATFRSVFAFNLSDLAGLSGLEQGAVRELLFSAGVVGAGRRAATAKSVLDDELATLVRPRKPEAVVSRLLCELDEIDDLLRRA
ncbi:MAG TPA: AAA family ATPase, partial [Acidimicrobiales bacterium]|nr:AAA family ATPase [Acidimicrobiales bacterium]